MVTTYPDYTSKYKGSTLFKTFDTAELASRLGSPMIFSKTGTVQYSDIFDGAVLLWNKYTNGVGASLDIMANHALFGHQSVRLRAGAAAGGYAYMTKYLRVRDLGRIGLEVTFALDENTTEFYFELDQVENKVQHRFGIKVDKANDEIEYYDGAWKVAATNVVIYHGLVTWHTFKVIGDTTTNMYDKLIYDNTEIDLSAYPMLSGVTIAENHTMIVVQHDSDHAVAKDVYVDGVILTEHE